VRLEQFAKFVRRKPRLPQYGAERASIDFFMVRHDNLSEGYISPKDDMTTVLPFDLETSLEKSGDALAPRDSGQAGHTARSTASNRSGGTARPSSCNARM
jgi:hypothetical protein